MWLLFKSLFDIILAKYYVWHQKQLSELHFVFNQLQLEKKRNYNIILHESWSRISSPGSQTRFKHPTLQTKEHTQCNTPCLCMYYALLAYPQVKLIFSTQTKSNKLEPASLLIM